MKIDVTVLKASLGRMASAKSRRRRTARCADDNRHGEQQEAIQAQRHAQSAAASRTMNARTSPIATLNRTFPGDTLPG
jgi:hypothetical protein